MQFHQAATNPSNSLVVKLTSPRATTVRVFLRAAGPGVSTRPSRTARPDTCSTSRQGSGTT